MKSYKRLYFVSLGLNIIVLSFVFTPLTNYLYAFLEVESEIKKANAIILLSSGQYTNDILARDTYQRLFHAYKLYRLGYADKVIICGGIQIKGNPTISETMKGMLINLGIHGDNIITEEGSRNTYENLKNIIPVLNTQKIMSSLLITSSYHMYRSMAVCRMLGVSAYPAPVPCYEKKISNFLIRTRHVITVLREYGAIAYFWFRGWI